MVRTGVEPATYGFQIQHSNHSATLPLWVYEYTPSWFPIRISSPWLWHFFPNISSCVKNHLLTKHAWDHIGRMSAVNLLLYRPCASTLPLQPLRLVNKIRFQKDVKEEHFCETLPDDLEQINSCHNKSTVLFPLPSNIWQKKNCTSKC